MFSLAVWHLLCKQLFHCHTLGVILRLLHWYWNINFNIQIAHKLTRTSRHLLTNVKDKDDPKDRQGTVYRIRCNDCSGTYIGETGRTLTTRLGEHQTATDKEDLTNNITQHHRKTGHDINWDSVTCLTHSTDKDQRLTLESWLTNLQPNPLNRSRKLPVVYERFLQSEYRTANKNTDWLW